MNNAYLPFYTEFFLSAHIFLLCSGYMSPEYAIDGLFSVKSDVFSFGVIVLEILSGKKNRGFDHPDHDLNLLGHVSFRLNILFFSLPNFPFSYVSINKLKILSRHGNYGMKVGRWS